MSFWRMRRLARGRAQLRKTRSKSFPLLADGLRAPPAILLFLRHAHEPVCVPNFHFAADAARAFPYCKSLRGLRRVARASSDADLTSTFRLGRRRAANTARCRDSRRRQINFFPSVRRQRLGNCLAAQLAAHRGAKLLAAQLAGPLVFRRIWHLDWE